MVNNYPIYFVQYMMSEHTSRHVSRYLTDKAVYEVGFDCPHCDFTMSGYVMHPHEANKKRLICINCRKPMKHTGVIRILGDNEERLVV